MATAKQIAARKKFVAAVRAGKFRKGKKRVAKKRATKKRVAKKVVRKRTASKRVVRKTTIAVLKSNIREKLDDQLKDQLFKRDKATTAKQHRTAQKKIDNIRKELRKQK